MGLKTSVAELSSSRAAVEASLAGSKHELEAARWDHPLLRPLSISSIIMACCRAQVAALSNENNEKKKLIEEGE